MESLAGTRPGDGLADKVFNLVLHRITQRIRKKTVKEMGIGGFFANKGTGPGNYSTPDMIDMEELYHAWTMPSHQTSRLGRPNCSWWSKVLDARWSGQAFAMYRKFGKQLFQNRLLSLGKTHIIYLFKSMVLSVLTTVARGES